MRDTYDEPCVGQMWAPLLRDLHTHAALDADSPALCVRAPAAGERG